MDSTAFRWLIGRRGDMVEGALTLPLMALVNLALAGCASVTADNAVNYAARVASVAQANPAGEAMAAANRALQAGVGEYRVNVAADGVMVLTCKSGWREQCVGAVYTAAPSPSRYRRTARSMRSRAMCSRAMCSRAHSYVSELGSRSAFARRPSKFSTGTTPQAMSGAPPRRSTPPTRRKRCARSGPTPTSTLSGTAAQTKS